MGRFIMSAETQSIRAQVLHFIRCQTHTSNAKTLQSVMRWRTKEQGCFDSSEPHIVMKDHEEDAN